MFRSIIWLMLMLRISEDLREVRQAVLGEDADITNQTGDAACTESTSTEAKDENLVAGLVVVGDELVAFAHDLRQSFARDTQQLVRDTATRTDAPVVVNNLLDTIGADGLDGTG